jgi:putative transposase
LFGYTRDAYYKAKSRQKNCALDCITVLDLAITEKALLKNSGIKKIYHRIKPQLIKLGIKMGRDKFYALMKANGLLIQKKKFNKPKTDSKHAFFKYKNLIKDLNITKANQVWVSDITYIKVNNKWHYLTLIMDLFSRKIIGYAFSSGMSVEETTAPAMKMALKFKDNNKPLNTILHSDRGLQYCAPLFTKKFDKDFDFSNTQGGDPYENAVADCKFPMKLGKRVNGILKYEFDLKDNFKNMAIAKKEIDKAIHIYNSIRPHWSLDLKTPDEVFFENINSTIPMTQ